MRNDMPTRDKNVMFLPFYSEIILYMVSNQQSRWPCDDGDSVEGHMNVL